uniref:HotDog ACOT-type domain-containing protein n=1 Tax=Lotharella globosa TaxID=91324 RepID=A0A6U3EJP1_9EUKA
MAENYCNPWGQVRMGKILEDLDAMAGNIAMRHTRQADACRPLVIVTAGVDRIKLLGRAGINEDMVLEGAVTWTGRSSMEIGMQVHTAGRLWICANFTFVARDPETGRAAAVNKLIINTKEEQTLFDLADARQREKKGKRKKSKTQFDRQHTPEQARRMQDLLDKAAPLKRMPALAPKDAILMYKTQLSNALTCQPVHQNIHGRVFGGFLMRRAFELAFATAHLFSGGRPQFLEVDDVSFKLPVSIGDLLQLESVVLYTVQKDAKTEGGVNVKDHPEIHVEVVANVSDPGKVTSNMSNSFNFTFCVPDKDEVLNVYPGTVVEAERVVRMMTLDEDQERHDEEAAEADPSGNGPACR